MPKVKNKQIDYIRLATSYLSMKTTNKYSYPCIVLSSGVEPRRGT